MTNAEELRALRDKIERDLPASAGRDRVRATLLDAASLLEKMEGSTLAVAAAALCGKDLSTLRQVEKDAWIALAGAKVAAAEEAVVEAQKAAEALSEE